LNVLITSASRKVGLVRAFQEALARTGGGKVVAVDSSPLSPALLVADEHAIVARSEASNFLPTIYDLCRRHEVGLLVPTRDEELPIFAAEKKTFGGQGVVALVSSPAAVRTCQDKRAFVEFCAREGFAVPRTWAPGERPAASAFPVFAKPRFGKGGRGAGPVATPEELEFLLARDPDAIVQELVEAPELTVDLFADLSGEIVSVIPRYRTRVVGGESFVSRTVKNARLLEEAAAVARALGLVGHNTIQYFFDGDDCKLVEINPRFGGAASLGFAAGAPTPEFAVRIALGQRVAPRIGEFTEDLVMLRYTEDRFVAGSTLDAMGTS
jgi:carbamoyl-phosphate synthase large subunit